MLRSTCDLSVSIVASFVHRSSLLEKGSRVPVRLSLEDLTMRVWSPNLARFQKARPSCLPVRKPGTVLVLVHTPYRAARTPANAYHSFWIVTAFQAETDYLKNIIIILLLNKDFPLKDRSLHDDTLLESNLYLSPSAKNQRSVGSRRMRPQNKNIVCCVRCLTIFKKQESLFSRYQTKRKTNIPLSFDSLNHII